MRKVCGAIRESPEGVEGWSGSHGGGVPGLLTCFHLGVTRYCCCRFVATPLADVWGIRDRIRLRPEANPLLENYFCQKARAPSQVGPNLHSAKDVFISVQQTTSSILLYTCYKQEMSFKSVKRSRKSETSFILVSQADVRTLCKKTSWTERKMQVWFRRRRNQDRAGLRKRFSEARCDGGSVTDVGISRFNPRFV